MKLPFLLLAQSCRIPLSISLLLALAVLLGGCGEDKKKPAQLYDSGQEVQQKAVADQEQAAYRKKMHDQHKPGY